MRPALNALRDNTSELLHFFAGDLNQLYLDPVVPVRGVPEDLRDLLVDRARCAVDRRVHTARASGRLYVPSRT
jgi:hypothetical protein